MSQTHKITVGPDAFRVRYGDLTTGAIFRFDSGENYYIRTDRAGSNGAPMCVLIKNGNTFSPTQDKAVIPLSKGTLVNIHVGEA